MNDTFQIFTSRVIKSVSDYGPADGCFDPFEDEDAIEELMNVGGFYQRTEVIQAHVFHGREPGHGA